MLIHVRITKGKRKNLTDIISSIVLLLCSIALIFYSRYQLLLPISCIVITIFLVLFLFLLRIISKIVARALKLKAGESIHKEIFRKSFHFIMLILILPRDFLFSIYQAGIFTINSLTIIFHYNVRIMTEAFLRDALIILAGSAVFVFILFEVMRINFGIVLYPNILIRSIEEKSIAAHFYTALSIFFVSLIFPEKIVIPSIIIPIIQDAMAAIVGRSIGRITIIEGRTLEGCVAGFITSVVLGLLFLDIFTAILLGIILEIIDFLSNILNINDNLLFPIISALTLQVVTLALNI